MGARVALSTEAAKPRWEPVLPVRADGHEPRSAPRTARSASAERAAPDESLREAAPAAGTEPPTGRSESASAADRSRPLRTLASVSPAYASCFSDVTASVAANVVLELRWRNQCQASAPESIWVTVELYDEHQARLASFPTEQLGVIFWMAGRILDGPLAVGTTMLYDTGERISDGPQEQTIVRLPLAEVLSNDLARRVRAARISFRIGSRTRAWTPRYPN